MSIKPDVHDVQYEWTISDGKLLRGQGTTKIDVEVPQGGSVTAAISVKGLPAGCPDLASEVMQNCGPLPQAVRLDEFVAPVADIETARIDRIRSSVDQNPNSLFLVCVGVKPQMGDAARRRRIGELADALRESNYEWRFTFVTVESDRELSQIWIVPPGADMPVCEE